MVKSPKTEGGLTKLEKLFKYQAVLRRHKDAPFLKEREQYLLHRANEGCAQATLIRISRELFWVARYFKGDEKTARALTPEDIQKAANKWARKQCRSGRAKDGKWSRQLFIQLSTDWFQFLGRLQKVLPREAWYASLIQNFATFMACERGLSPHIMLYTTYRGTTLRASTTCGHLRPAGIYDLRASTTCGRNQKKPPSAQSSQRGF